MKSFTTLKGLNEDNHISNRTFNDADFHHFYDDFPVAFYICDKEGYLIYSNPAAKELWGTNPQKGEVRWDGSWKVYYADGRIIEPENHPVAGSLKRDNKHTGDELVIERPDHSRRNVRIFPRAVLDEHQEISSVHVTIMDVTAQQNSYIKQSILSAIVESSDDAILSKDLTGIIKSWNSGAEAIFGYTEEEVRGRSISVIIPEDRLAEEEKILQDVQQGKKVRHFETIRKAKDGREIPISLTVSPIKDNQGRIIGASSIARDISGARAQAQIKKYSENLEILNSVGRSISENLDVQEILQQVTDASTKLTGAAFGAFFYNHVNEEGQAMMLYTLSGAPREAFEQFGMPRHTQVFKPTFAGQGIVRVDDIRKDERYGKNDPYSGMPQGHLPVVSYLAVPVVSKSGSVIGGLIFGHPERGMFKEEHEKMVLNIAAQAAISIDNSKLFEQVKLLSSKKDEFIALASHELKTPLTTIKGYLQVLAKTEKDGMSALFLNKSLNQVNKLTTLVDDLLNMSRIEAGKLEFSMENFDIRQMLQEVIEMFSYTYPSHQIVFDPGQGSAVVRADKQRIEQVVLNLLNNALKYSPEADEIQVQLENTDNDLTVKVQDKGIGLTPEQQSQLFTRFYRADNKRGISGLGLGLYLSKQIIDRHGGSLSVKSEIGQGSEFSFTLAKNLS